MASKMFWWSKPSTKDGGPAPAAAAAGGEVAVQKVFYNLVSKAPMDKLKPAERESPKEDIDKKADRFIRETKRKLFGQHKSFQGRTAGDPAAAAAAASGRP